jgi:DNA (cytosine-5)-methyltransferase 1
MRTPGEIRQPAIASILSDHLTAPRFIDLFAGIGGFRVALTAAGAECVFANDCDKFALKTYGTWFGTDHLYGGDIRDPELIRQIPDHDILCAGFPCQPFSSAGIATKTFLGSPHGFADPRQGTLFFSVLQIIDRHRPPVVLLENVKHLRSHHRGNTWRVIHSALASRDYIVFDKTVDAKHWVPQHRERLFLVCFDRHVFGCRDEIPFVFPETPVTPAPVLGDILEARPDPRYMLSDRLWIWLQAHREKHQSRGNGFGYGLFGPDQVARTLSARYYKDGSEILVAQANWRNPRRLTPREAMRLMGFTDKYAALFGYSDEFPLVVSDTQAYRQFGNAVVPAVAEFVANSLIPLITSRRIPRGTAALSMARLPAHVAAFASGCAAPCPHP